MPFERAGEPGPGVIVRSPWPRLCFAKSSRCRASKLRFTSTTASGRLRYLLHALLGVPRALQLADNNHLSHVIRIVRPDVRDFRSPSLQLLVISGFEKVFQFGHPLVELLDRVVPLLGIKVVKGFVIVAAELLFGFSLELGQFLFVPEQQMIGQLSEWFPLPSFQLAWSAVSPSTATLIGTNQSFSLCVVRNCSSSMLRSVAGFGLCAQA